MCNISKCISENFSTLILEKLRPLAVGQGREQSFSVKKTYEEPLTYYFHSPVFIEVILKLHVIVFDRSYRKTNKQTNKAWGQTLYFMTVISEYAETPMRPVYKHLHISIGISGETHGIKDKHKHRCFQEINTIPYAIYAHFVLMPFCEYCIT